MAPTWLLRWIKKIYQSTGLAIVPDHVFEALGNLYDKTLAAAGDDTLKIAFDPSKDKFVVLSDQHRGNSDNADDFKRSANNHQLALDYYLKEGYTYINLGDSEECWKNNPKKVMDAYQVSLEKEAVFLQQKRFYKLYGNHDNTWAQKRYVGKYLQPIFGNGLQVLQSLMLTTSFNKKPFHIFLAHGHQGDDVNDQHYRWTKLKVRYIWAPMERIIKYNPNKASRNYGLKDGHNKIMYDWISKKNDAIFIAGHTHIAVFESLNLLEKLTNKEIEAPSVSSKESIKKEIKKEENKAEATAPKTKTVNNKPSYYNTGCCCFSDGDITCIEIEGGEIRLIKWELKKGIHTRLIKDHSRLEDIAGRL